ncbi:L-aspartate oxidase [Evansella clarkii]|jgi:L-aspartate oxidase|uniref:L-aspartate oxidase n=1 Tax=Evansella clarkii TaxID=79879 RepID=UPI000B444A09|nr:L-aspartate oxidase [Evansella clarkii]
MKKHDVIIIGGGMSALVAANKLAGKMNVKIFTKKLKNNCNSWRAQGGIAAAVHNNDSPFHHYSDTLKAGCLHNDHGAVSLLVKEGVTRLNRWIAAGMSFDTDSSGSYLLGMEGAHGKRRILHAGGDQTGVRMMQYLYDKAALSSDIQIYENEQAVELLSEGGKCSGIITKGTGGRICGHRAHFTILATGGCGALFQQTSNDTSIIGDGIAMAYRAGAALSDLEFLQFHPTLIVQNGKTAGLASEAIRGEGAILTDEKGCPIMKGVHPLKDLAPRDIVARVIEGYVRQKKQVYLDITPINNFRERFPAIYKICQDAGISLDSNRIPVSPGAHFLMGGVLTDTFGRTTLPGLYAIGETARTGVHGANRLASNSLLEALVFSERAAESILIEAEKITPAQIRHNQHFEKQNTSCKVPALPSRKEIQSKITVSLGVERNEEKLKSLEAWLQEQGAEYHAYADRTGWNREKIERSNMLLTAWLMARSALERTESRGAHYRTDFPKPDQYAWQGKQIIRQLQPERLPVKN